MRSVDEAREAVRRRARPVSASESVALAEAAGRVLAAPLLADRDDPPFDRAMMDGFAVRAADVERVPAALRVVGEAAAGDAHPPEVGRGCAVRINTGAAIPPGADAVVPVEETRGEVEVLAAVRTGASVLARGTLIRRGDVAAEGVLTPERIAVCASVGADPVRVLRRPRVAVLATGSELVRDPGAHEIRNSNGPMLRALLGGHEVLDLGSVRDEPREVERAIARGLSCDAIVTTGGVSMGEKDYVREAMEACGIRILFHGIPLQPGRPILFGEHDGGVAFGLPGNPVSALVCADLFVLPFLAGVAGRSFDDALAERPARLAATVGASPKRRRVLPCLLHRGMVTPLPWRGSADLHTAARGNAYVIVEAGADLPAGTEVTCLIPERHAASAL